jgi:hypothetical protein
MKTPYLDEKINELEISKRNKDISNIGLEMLEEYKAIKQLIENYPIVSTPDNPVWVLDDTGEKTILWMDLTGYVINYNFVLVHRAYINDFLRGHCFDYRLSNTATPYTPKVNIEVTEEEAIKVEEFLKTLRNGN